MNQIASLVAPEALYIHDSGENTHYGAQQTWYTTRRQRISGCGPTVCANLMHYIASTRPHCTALCPPHTDERRGMLALLEETWQYVTPGFGGVSRTDHFAEGALRFASTRGVSLAPHVLNIPGTLRSRPSLDSMMAFLCIALRQDVPLAFLNLSKGALRNLYGWHWVTIIAANPTEGTVMALDEGKAQMLDMALWRESSLLGGGFVYLLPMTV